MKKLHFYSTIGALLLFAGFTASCGDDAKNTSNAQGGEEQANPDENNPGDVNSDEKNPGETNTDDKKDPNEQNPDDKDPNENKDPNEQNPDDKDPNEQNPDDKDPNEQDPNEGNNEDNKPKDPGAMEEEVPETDDSDVLEGYTLPEPLPLSGDPCLACTNTQECVNNACNNSTRHNVSVSKAYTKENGETASFGITLTRKPIADVTLKCWIESTSPYPEAKIECPGTIAAGSWNQYTYSGETDRLTVTVTGLPDNVDDGDKKYYVMLETITADPYFSNIVHSPMEFTNRNIDTAGVVWDVDQTLLTGEDGRTATYSLRLQSKPVAPVKLKLHSTDITEGTVDPKVITIQPEDWNVPQTVTVTGVDDEFEDGAVSYAIKTTAVSADPKYNGIHIDDVPLSNIDNDSALLAISTANYKLMPVTEASPTSDTTTLSLMLSVQPQKDVNVAFSLTNYIISITPSTAVFNSENWNEPQTFEVKLANPDYAKQAITSACIVATSTSEDEAYDYKFSNRRCLDVYRYAPLNFESTKSEQTVMLLPGEYKLEAWGSQGSGSLNSLGGYGGYTYGTVEFFEDTNVYINVGDIPYNGGGPGQAQGGGATHIATVSGLLSTLSEQRDKVLIVAGGGGGSERTPGGYGGGEVGGIGNSYSYTTVVPTGGTQTEGGIRGETSMYGVGSAGTFGKGGDGTGQAVPENPNPHVDSGGGGGGGWYGGGGIPYAGGGGGGSGHLNENVKGETIAGSETFESPTGGTEAGHAGSGYARISIVERPPMIVY